MKYIKKIFEKLDAASIEKIEDCFLDHIENGDCKIFPRMKNNIVEIRVEFKKFSPPSTESEFELIRKTILEELNPALKRLEYRGFEVISSEWYSSPIRTGRNWYGYVEKMPEIKFNNIFLSIEVALKGEYPRSDQNVI